MRTYPTGALKDKKDLRKIKLHTFVLPVEVPEQFFVNSGLPIYDQKQLGACVGYAHARVVQYLNLKETGKVEKISPRYIYAMAKQTDGMPNTQGTFPRVASNIGVSFGAATENTVPNNADLTHQEYIAIENSPIVKKDAYPYRIKGYTDASFGDLATYEEIQQAIYRFGEVVASISIGGYSNPIKKGNKGLHRITLVGYGYEKLKVKNGKLVPTGKKEGRVLFANSWGESWGVKGYGWFDIKNQEVTDFEVWTDIPNEILDEAKLKPKAILTRQPSSPKQTLGELVATRDGKTFTCKTLELPWIDNRRNISCIPKGEYAVKKFNSPKRGLVYALQDVSGRTGIQIHVGNYHNNTEGCILVGNAFSDVNKDGYLDVINSRLTFDKLMAFFGDSPFTLIIK